jgi:hypothetical protein
MAGGREFAVDKQGAVVLNNDPFANKEITD